MSFTKNFEIKGNLREHPFAELLIEISKNRLNGSLRIEGEMLKIVTYFDAGDVVFVVSNARLHRLYEILLREQLITKDRLVTIANFTADFPLSENLLKNKVFTKAEIDRLFSKQIEEVLASAVNWQEGEWIFSPLIRIKGDIRFEVDSQRILIDYARKLPNATIMRRFRGLKEKFGSKAEMDIHTDLMPSEAFVLSRFEKTLLSVEEISALSGMPETETFKVLYSLWMGGFIARQDWKAAFNSHTLSTILTANFTLKKNEETDSGQKITPVNMQTVETKTDTSTEDAPEIAPEEKLSLEDYLQRAETAGSHYDFLGVAVDASASDIKSAYFALAKNFHPDLYYKKSAVEIYSRVQDAFTKLANAYETLKNENSREVYNFKMRKQLEEKENAVTSDVASEDGSVYRQARQAAEDFSRGYNLLMDGNNEASLPFLTRAVYYDKENARYHAFYGKALSSDKSQYHKAEAEMQTAIKLDAENPDYRIILSEFFIKIGLRKRAEGELNRLLAFSPGNEEAQALLDSIGKR